ncbi:unnamed protein product [Linum tenue]|uniref:UDP-arabinopyranose mutase 5 n=1 Tax=Linum tenue TaxID=586396 RepID=A0AAV0RVR1_9ROSI|nr:unnamed protein product [Linum tenue]
MRTQPPSLLSLAVDASVLHLSHFSDLSPLPDHILLDLFLKRTLRAGKLNEKILKLFLATGKEEVLSLIQTLNIQHILTPVLPTKSPKMSVVNNIEDGEIDIVIGALHSDLRPFMSAWKSIFSRYHLIIVKDPDLKDDLQITEGLSFKIDIYTKSHIDKVVGSSTSIAFSGYSCKYFGFLVSRKKYIVSIDDDCVPAKDADSILIDPVAQHLRNLATPATPFFFNTLYDPYRNGADFVRGLRCTNTSTEPEKRNSRYVDAVMTVPARVMMPISGINIAFNREVVGPALCPALRLTVEGKVRWETMEDIWSGMCVKVVCDHLGLGVKSGLPYVWRNDRGDAIESLKKEWEGVKLMEEVVPWFQSMVLSRTATTAEDCVAEMAKRVKEQLGGSDPGFGRAAEAMMDWVELWKKVGSGPSPV